MKQILVLDFDGVIADSQMECLFLGFNAYLHFNKSSKLFDGKLFSFENFSFLAQKHREIVEKYKALRPYVVDAFCYYVVMSIIEKRIEIKSTNEYNNIRKELSKGVYDEFVQYFHNSRLKLLNEHPNEWLNLVRPYSKFISSVKNISDRFYLAVSTNNKKFAIDAFSKNHGLDPKLIIDSSIGSDKKVHIEKIKSTLDVNFKDIYFVDDQLKNFIKVLPLGVKCYLATWGYNTEEQRKEKQRQLQLIKIGQRTNASPAGASVCGGARRSSIMNRAFCHAFRTSRVSAPTSTPARRSPRSAMSRRMRASNICGVMSCCFKISLYCSMSKLPSGFLRLGLASKIAWKASSLTVSLLCATSALSARSEIKPSSARCLRQSRSCIPSDRAASISPACSSAWASPTS